MPITLQQLANLAGVSHTTVSLVLAGKHLGRVSEPTRRRVLRLAEEHGYRPNPAARGLVKGRYYRVGICIHDYMERRAVLGQFSFYDSLALLSRGIQGAGFAIELLEIDPRRKPADVCRDLARRALDGFIALGWDAPQAEKVLFSLSEKRIPAVAVGTSLDDPELSWADVDRAAAIRDATFYLLEQGHESIALLDIDIHGRYRRLKNEAFRSAMREKLGSAAAARIFGMSCPSLEEVARLTDEALRKEPHVEAFILTDNFYAEGVMLALSQRGIVPGTDCRIVGFGDTALADRTHPRLTHYSLMVPEQVSFALDVLFEAIRDPAGHEPRSRMFRSRLLLRET